MAWRKFDALQAVGHDRFGLGGRYWEFSLLSSICNVIVAILRQQGGLHVKTTIIQGRDGPYDMKKVVDNLPSNSTLSLKTHVVYLLSRSYLIPRLFISGVFSLASPRLPLISGKQVAAGWGFLQPPHYKPDHIQLHHLPTLQTIVCLIPAQVEKYVPQGIVRTS